MTQEGDISLVITEPTSEIKKLHEICDKLTSENMKLQNLVSSMRADMDKLKSSLNEKVSKPVFNELEGKINTHSKALD